MAAGCGVVGTVYCASCRGKPQKLFLEFAAAALDPNTRKRCTGHNSMYVRLYSRARVVLVVVGMHARLLEWVCAGVQVFELK